MAAEQYFEMKPGSPSRPRTVTVASRGVTAELEADRGTFSSGRLDPGTQILLDVAPAPAPNATVLDLGCGWGPVGIVQALRQPDAVIWGVDVNERAVQTARRNARSAGVGERTHWATPDEVPRDLGFDALYSNPPIRIGKAALHELLLSWLGRLNPGGGAWLVVSRHLGADSLQEWLTEQGHRAQRLASRRGYRVLTVEAKEAA